MQNGLILVGEPALTTSRAMTWLLPVRNSTLPSVRHVWSIKLRT